jgi:hypothetical protein
MRLSIGNKRQTLHQYRRQQARLSPIALVISVLALGLGGCAMADSSGPESTDVPSATSTIATPDPRVSLDTLAKNALEAVHPIDGATVVASPPAPALSSPYQGNGCAGTAYALSYWTFPDATVESVVSALQQADHRPGVLMGGGHPKGVTILEEYAPQTHTDASVVVYLLVTAIDSNSAAVAVEAQAIPPASFCIHY